MILVITFVRTLSSLYFNLLFLYGIMGWFPGLATSRFAALLRWAVSPLLAPLQRWDLQFAGLDWTVILAMLLLDRATVLVLQFLYWLW